MAQLKLFVDEQTIKINNNGKAELKLSTDANNGLSFDENGKLIATKGSGSSSSDGNTPGNAIGPIDATSSQKLPILGYNSSVSRHQKYPGSDPWIKNNDGPVMTKLENGGLSQDCVASYMIAYTGGGT